MRVLVVDDEPEILELVRYNLSQEDYLVDTVETGEAALKRLEDDLPAVVVLDVMLPGLSGIEVCRAIKDNPRTEHLPVIMLTARTEDQDIVTGLEAGADDYVTKPFSPRVLLARVRAALRRQPDNREPAIQGNRFTLHGIMIDIDRHEVTCRDQFISLSATEFAILEFLSRNPGWVFSRARIIDAIRGEDYPVTERSVDVQVLGIRRKLGPCGAVLETVRGVGYRMRSV